MRAAFRAHLVPLLAASALALPHVVQAANECGDVTANGTAADSFTCPAGSYGSGISYDTSGNLTLTSDGAINAGSTGFSLTGNGSNQVNLNTLAGAVNGSGGINIGGPGTGAVTVNAGNVDGDITIDRLSGAVTAHSTSGDITINRFRPLADPASVSGNITASTAGNLTVVRAGSGNMVLDTSAGSGLMQVTHTNTARTSSLSGGLNATIGSGGLLLDITGTAPPQAGTNNRGESGFSGLTVQGSGNASIHVGRSQFYRSLDVSTTGITDDVSIAELRAFARLQGAMNFSGLTGDVDLTVGSGGIWVLSADAQLTAGGHTAITIEENGYLWTARGSSTNLNLDAREGSNASPFPASTRLMQFASDGSSQIDNHGRFLVGAVERGNVAGGFSLRDFDGNDGDLRLLALDTFNNYGDIHLGVLMTEGAGQPPRPFTDRPFGFFGTDRSVDDILTMQGSHFVGHAGSRIFMDFDLTAEDGAQNACDNSLRNTANSNRLPGADCVDLRGGSTEGVTGLALGDINRGDLGRINRDGIVVVDVGGGQSAQGHFVVDPASLFYGPQNGGSYDRGLVMYTVVYDEAAQQHKLVGLPSGAALHQPMLLSAATTAWRTASGSFFDRQADLRDTLRGAGEREHGVWLRTSYEMAERDLRSVQATTFGVDVALDNTHDVDTSAVTLGLDFLRGGSGDRYWLLGGMMGYVRTDLNFNEWANTAFMNGISMGAYGSYVSGPLFVDAVINSTWARMDQRIPQAQFVDNRPLSADVEALGLQLEAGWRFDLGAARLEPLLNLSHVTASIDNMQALAPDVTTPGISLHAEDTTSQRAGLGLRGSTELPLGTLRLGLSLTGRFSSELDGESRTRMITTGEEDPLLLDAFDGTFTELTGGLTLANATGRVSGVLNIGTRSGEDYSATSASASFRYQW